MKKNLKNYRLGYKVTNVELSYYGNDVSYELYLKNIRTGKVYDLGEYSVTTCGTDPYTEFIEYGYGIDYLNDSKSTIDRLNKAFNNNDYDVLEKYYCNHSDDCDASVGQWFIEHADFDYYQSSIEVHVNTFIEAERWEDGLHYYEGDTKDIIFEDCIEDFDCYDEDTCISWFKINNEEIFAIEVDEEDGSAELYVLDENLKDLAA